MRVIRNLLEAVNEPVGFLTLTLPSFPDPVEAVSRALEVKKRFYNFRLFGRRKWPQVKQKALELLEVYLQRVADERERERRREFHLWTLRRFEEAWADQLYNSKGKFYLGRILRSVWKLEMTYNPQAGWHPHFHVLVVGLFPLFLLQAVWVMCGGGEVIDLRLVRGAEGVAEYVAEYEGKPVASVEDGELTHEQQVALEAALYGRKLFEVWGLAELEQKVEDGYELVAVARRVKCELELDNLHELPRLVRQLRKQSRDGPAMMFLCWATVEAVEWIGGEAWEFKARAGVFLDEAGRLWLVGDEKFERIVDAWSVKVGRWRAEGLKRRAEDDTEDDEAWGE